MCSKLNKSEAKNQNKKNIGNAHWWQDMDMDKTKALKSDTVLLNDTVYFMKGFDQEVCSNAVLFRNICVNVFIS